MADVEEPDSTHEPEQARGAAPNTPASALLAARLGGAIALGAAASLSFNALCDLARHAGLHHLAALLPIAVDALAVSALFVSYRLPAGHTAHRAASRTARLALALTIACNGLDHLLDLAGYLLTKHVRDLLLVAVASLPPLIVERLLHLQTALIGDGCRAATEFVTGQGRPTLTGQAAGVVRSSVITESVSTAEAVPPERAIELVDPAGYDPALTDHDAVQRPGEVGQTGHAHDEEVRRAGRPAEERWLSVAVPVYRELASRTGRRPTESAFHAALTDALIAGLGADREIGPESLAPMSLSTAKRIRALVEDCCIANAG